MRILITGGAGFIGSNLCKKLWHEGHEIFCVDNFYTGNSDNIKDLINSNNFHVIIADISEPFNSVSRIDQIYNLACPASPPHYQKDPVQTMKTNVVGTANMLELARKTGAKFLQASTSEIYGDPEIHPQPESYWGNVNPLSIRSCYDEGKRAAETLCFDYHRQYGVDTKIVRIFNTFGVNMEINDGRVISNFIVQALRNDNITIYGDGTQTRSFQYVSDLIDGMTKLMNSKYSGPYNIGNPEEYTMNEIAEIIIEETGSKSKIIYTDLPEGDPKQRKPVIDKAKLDLDWLPIIRFTDGLKSTIEYFKNII